MAASVSRSMHQSSRTSIEAVSNDESIGAPSFSKSLYQLIGNSLALRRALASRRSFGEHESSLPRNQTGFVAPFSA
jgi:hypothetical protein